MLYKNIPLPKYISYLSANLFNMTESSNNFKAVIPLPIFLLPMFCDESQCSVPEVGCNDKGVFTVVFLATSPP